MAILKGQHDEIKKTISIGIDSYKEIFKLKNIAIEKIETFIIIEESYNGKDLPPNFNRNGIVICNTSDNAPTYTYEYFYTTKKENSLILSDNFNDKSNPNFLVRKTLFDIATYQGFKAFYSLEKVFTGESKLDYKIVGYHKSKEIFDTIYLHNVTIKPKK